METKRGEEEREGRKEERRKEGLNAYFVETGGRRNKGLFVLLLL